MAKPMDRPAVGCFADDFTGAGDAASFLAAGGLRTLLRIGTDDEPLPPGVEAVVVALKSRSIPARQAVDQSLAAVRLLQKLGAERFYFKYCSTFDSTRQGNIGPVCDALLRELRLPYTLLCPALLPNGRLVRGGILYVNGVPLAQSPMKNHPLNPMWDSSIRALMEAQSEYPCFEVDAETLEQPQALLKKIQELCGKNKHFYLIPEQYLPQHGPTIVRQFAALPLLTGGSGLLEPLARAESAGRPQPAPRSAPEPRFGRLMVAGSCSEMSHRQIDAWQQAGGRALAVEPEMVFEQAKTARETLAAAYLNDPARDILYYTSPRRGTRPGLAEALERFNAELVRTIVKKLPVERLIVAGGETSGAVTQALGLRDFEIGQSVAPGVPILQPVQRPEMRIVLKSGNFGTPEFFLNTLTKGGL